MRGDGATPVLKSGNDSKRGWASHEILESSGQTSSGNPYCRHPPRPPRRVHCIPRGRTQDTAPASGARSGLESTKTCMPGRLEDVLDGRGDLHQLALVLAARFGIAQSRARCGSSSVIFGARKSKSQRPSIPCRPSSRCMLLGKRCAFLNILVLSFRTPLRFRTAEGMERVNLLTASTPFLTSLGTASEALS